MNNTPLVTRHLISWILWILCVATGTFFIFWTPLWTLPLEDGAPLWIWRTGSLQAIRPGVIALLIALPGAFTASFIAGRAAQNTRLAPLAPLASLPLVAALEWATDFLPVGVMANARFFLPLALGAWSIARLWPEREATARPTRPWLALLILPIAAFYASTCYHAAKTVGPSAGDECCYIIMSDSLYTDHSLDTKRAWARNYQMDNPDQLVSRGHMHLASNARDGHWYSWHPFGLPLLLAPLWPLGPQSMVGRSLGMGLIAAIGCVGLWLLCRQVGASDRAALLSLALLCGSVCWTSYASRVLTEIPGATLLIWLFWAISAEEDRPWCALLVATFAAVYSAFVHLRFLPLGMLGAGFFGLAILLRRGPWRPKILRCVVFSLLLLVGYGTWFATQCYLYDGSAQPIADVLLSYPRGIATIFVDRFGTAAALPAMYGLLAAQLVWWQKDHGHRLLQMGVISTIAACATLNCSNICPFLSMWDCTPGRYLFAVSPLLTPGLAVALTGATRPAAAFFSFLGLVSVAMTVVYFFFLSSFGDMVHPLLHLAHLPTLLGLLMPFASFFEPSSTAARCATLLFAVCMVGVSYVLLRFRGHRWTPRLVLCLALVVVTAVVAHSAQKSNYTFTPGQVAAFLARLDRSHLQCQRPANAVRPSQDLMDNPLFDASQTTDGPLTIATTDLGVLRTNNTISLPRISDDNDWLGRPMRWATLVHPFKPMPGDWLLQIEGTVTGRIESVRLAIREGAHTRAEVELRLDAQQWQTEVAIEGRSGDLYVLAWAKGEGAWVITSIQWLPWNREWSLNESR